MNRTQSLFFCVVLATALAFTGCTTPVRLNLDHARFSKGYLNSSLLPEGALLVWNLGAETSRHCIVSVTPPDTTNNQKLPGVCGLQITETAKSDMEFSGGAQLTAEAAAEFHKLTQVYIEHFCSSRFQDPAFVLNEPDYAEKRAELGRQYADNPNYRFIFITGATLADEVDVFLGNPESGNSMVVAVGGKRFELSLANSSSSQWSGAQTPVFIRPTLFKLVRDPSGDTGYRFLVDTDTDYNFTRIVRDADI